MNKNIEKEFKLLISKEQFLALREDYEPLTFVKQVNQYYDNANKSVEKKHGAMRIRTKNNRHVFTLKIYDGHDLIEYECEVDDNAVHALHHPKIIALLKSFDIKGPYMKTASLTTNRAMIINEDAEICFDENFYNGCCDYEIEYEFKREHDGFNRFNQILRKIGVQFVSNCESKVMRALKK